MLGAKRAVLAPTANIPIFPAKRMDPRPIPTLGVSCSRRCPQCKVSLWDRARWLTDRALHLQLLSFCVCCFHGSVAKKLNLIYAVCLLRMVCPYRIPSKIRWNSHIVVGVNMNRYALLKLRVSHAIISNLIIFAIITSILSSCGLITETPTSTEEVNYELLQSLENPNSQELTLVAPIEVSTERSTIIPIPEPSATSTVEPTATEIPLPSISIDNLVYTHFENPESATWALLIKIKGNISILENSILEILINDTSYKIDGNHSLDDLVKYGGILFNYDESIFVTDDLEVNAKIIQGISEHQIFNTNVVNWSHIGAIPLPVDLDNNQFVVYHLDDMLAGTDRQTSFLDNYTSLVSQTNGFWICGIEQDHGNAIDIGYPSVGDNTKTPFSLSRDMEVSYTNFDSGDMGSKMVFVLPFQAIVELSDGTVKTTKLEYGIHHFVVTTELPIYNNFRNLKKSSLPAGTTIGVMERRGKNNAELHIGVYSPICFGSNVCDPYYPPKDPNALILPISLFLNSEDKEKVINSVLDCRGQ